jgi:DNA-binding transcriptional ArsR family regulator
MNVEMTTIHEDADLLCDFIRRSTVTSDALRALSHENRLMILCLLTGRERSVGEIEQILKLPQPAVSQQLARLRLDDLVASRRDGRTIYYTAETAKLERIYRDLGEVLGYASESAGQFARMDAEIEAVLARKAASAAADAPQAADVPADTADVGPADRPASIEAEPADPAPMSTGVHRAVSGVMEEARAGA